MIAIYNENLTITQSRYEGPSHGNINGTDLATNFILPFDCTVKRCGINKSGAVYLVIQSTKKYQTVCKKFNDYITLCFCHMPKNIWKNGTTLKKGNSIIMGSTGTNSSGIHLHLELGLGIMSGNSFIAGEWNFNIKKPLNIENAFYLKKGKKISYMFDAKKTPFTVGVPQDIYYANKLGALPSRFNPLGKNWYYMQFKRTPAIYNDFEATLPDRSGKFAVGEKQVSYSVGWNKRGWFMHGFVSNNGLTYYYAYIVRPK